MSVDFPEPFAPKRACTSPRRRARLTPLSTGLPSTNVFERFLMLTASTPGSVVDSMDRYPYFLFPVMPRLRERGRVGRDVGVEGSRGGPGRRHRDLGDIRPVEYLHRWRVVRDLLRTDHCAQRLVGLQHAKRRVVNTDFGGDVIRAGCQLTHLKVGTTTGDDLHRGRSPGLLHRGAGKDDHRVEFGHHVVDARVSKKGRG